jgi:cobaltochelatase CobT
MPDESHAEPLGRALAHAARSLAETPDLEVVFSNQTLTIEWKRSSGTKRV